MRHEFRCAAHVTAILWMQHLAIDSHDHRLLHLVGRNRADFLNAIATTALLDGAVTWLARFTCRRFSGRPHGCLCRRRSVGFSGRNIGGRRVNARAFLSRFRSLRRVSRFVFFLSSEHLLESSIWNLEFRPAYFACISRSRTIVRSRARDFFSCRIFFTASISPSANLKFKRNRDSFRRAASACKSSSPKSRYLSTSSRRFMVSSANSSSLEFRVCLRVLNWKPETL